MNNTRTDTEFAYKIRNVTDMTDKYGSPIRRRSLVFPTRSDTNRTIHSHTKDRLLRFWIQVDRNCTIQVTKRKAMISFAATAANSLFKPLILYKRKSDFLVTRFKYDFVDYD